MNRSVFSRDTKPPKPTPHTGWCARDHRCVGSLHQSPDIIADDCGGRATLTRVRAGDVEYVEIRARVPLGGNDVLAQRRLGLTLHLIRRLFAAVAAVRAEALTAGHGDRPAIEGRRAA
jgi:hypothetical protein